MVDESHENDCAAVDKIHDSAQSVDMRTFRLQEFDAEPTTPPDQWVGDIVVRIELGRAYLQSDEVSKLSEGSVVTLDGPATKPVDVYVAGSLVARGELHTLEERFCVRVTEVLAAGLKSRAA
jgi:flagellar motor switch protein FliN